MEPRKKADWVTKHRPSEILPPINPPPAVSDCPMICDKTIRVPRKAYELVHAMRVRALEKAAGGDDVGITTRVNIGRMVLKALQEFAVAHDLLPPKTNGGAK